MIAFMSQVEQATKPKRKFPSWVLAVLVLVSIGLKVLKIEHKQEVHQQQVEQVAVDQK